MDTLLECIFVLLHIIDGDIIVEVISIEVDGYLDVDACLPRRILQTLYVPSVAQLSIVAHQPGHQLTPRSIVARVLLNWVQIGKIRQLEKQ